MTIRLSTGLRNGLASGQGFGAMLNRGYINVYSGSQPVSADAAATGTLLGVTSLSGAALTKETRATGAIQITAAASGSINTITVGGLNIIPDAAVAAVAGDTAATASALCDAINRNGLFEATLASSTVTIKPRPGAGDAYNSATVAGSLTTVTATYTNVSGGVDPANGLLLAPPSAGIIAKPSTALWQFSGLTGGTAGWFRFYSSDTADSGALLSGAPWYSRMDGVCGVGSGDAKFSSLTVESGAPRIIEAFSFLVPAA